MERDRLRELADWPALGLPPAALESSAPLDERDLERLQAARALLAGEPPRAREALDALKPLFAERKYDIRAVAVLLQAVACDRPVVGAAAALDRLARLVSEDWEALGPVADDKRRKLANLAFPATLDQVRVALTAAAQSGQLDVHFDGWPEGRESRVWDLLCEAVTAAARDRQLDGVAAKIADVRAAWQPLVQKSQLVVEASAAGDEVSEAPPREPTPRTEGDLPARQSGGEVSLRASPHFFELLNKLRAFETLLERNDCGKAAIVAQDVEQTIASFDVRLFFPALFAGFFEGMAGCADELAAFQGELDAPSWRALAQLYRVDLEAFLRAGGKSRAGGRARD